MWPRWLAAAALIAMTVLTGVDVILRYFFHSPILGSYELTEYFMVVLVAFSITYTAVEGSHVEIEMLMTRLPKKVQSVTAIITNLMGLGLWVLICWKSIDTGIYIMESGQESSALHIPVFPFYFVVAAGCACMCPWFIANILNRLQEMLPR